MLKREADEQEGHGGDSGGHVQAADGQPDHCVDDGELEAGPARDLVLAGLLVDGVSTMARMMMISVADIDLSFPAC